MGPGAGPVTGPARGRTIALLTLMLAAHMVLVWLAREPGILTREDDAVYIALSQSLGHLGYNDVYRAGAPVHSQYPPVYPAMLAAWSAVFGDGFDALTGLTVLLSAASLLLIFRVLRRALGENLALLTVAVLAVNPHIVHFAGAPLSEIPYTFLTVVVLLVLARERAGAGTMVAAAFVALAAALTRSVGLTLVVALILYWLLESRTRAAVGFALVAGLVLGSWFLWTTMAPEQYVGASYVADLGASRSTGWVRPAWWRIPEHIAWYARIGVPWTMAVPTIPGTPIDNAVSAVVLWVSAAAGFLVFARRWRPGLLYTLAYGGLLSFWVWRTERFVVPVLFLLVAGVVAGAFAIGSRIGKSWGPAAAMTVAAFLMVGGAVRSAALVEDRFGCGRTADGLPPAACIKTDQASFFEAVRWIRANTAPDALLVSAKEAPLWLYTGRLTVGFRTALAKGNAGFLPYLRENDAAYILLGSLEFRETTTLLQRLEANCSELTVAAFFPARTWLFSLESPPTQADSERSCAAVAEFRKLNEGRDFDRDP